MKIMAFVGSPRKNANTDTLIDSVLEGARSVADPEVEKVYLYQADIRYCTGCGLHTVLKGSKECPLKDDMPGILARMQAADGFIFGSPNHGRTVSAAMTCFFSRMMPLLKMHVERDASGAIVHAESRPLIRGKKAVTVISQGDFWPSSSALVMMILDANLRDFQLRKVGEVVSTGNLNDRSVRDKPEDLRKAFEAGVRLVKA
jgi:multimeric flavodoxin WrbA